MNRKVNFDFLKIICIFLIIFHHFFIHSNMLVTIDAITFFNFSVSSIFASFGKVACLIFIIITGYFMIDKTIKPQKIFDLSFQLISYSLIIWFILKIFNIVPLNLKDFIKSFLSLIYGNWFVLTYIQLYIFIPFINSYLKITSKGEHFKLIILLLICFFSITTILPIELWKLSLFGCFITAYIIGAYFKLYPEKKCIKNIKLLILCITVLIILVNISIIYIDLNRKTHLIYYIFNNLYSMNSIITILFASFIFILFEQLNFKNTRVISFVSKSSLGIYLLHDNYLIRNLIWCVFLPNNIYISQPYFIIFMLIKVLLIFIVCLIIDKILMLIINKLKLKTFKFLNVLIRRCYCKWKNE